MSPLPMPPGNLAHTHAQAPVALRYVHAMQWPRSCARAQGSMAVRRWQQLWPARGAGPACLQLQGLR